MAPIYSGGLDMEEEVEKTKEEILKSFEKNENGKYVYKLKEHINHGSEKITEFILDTPKAKHVRSMPAKPGMGAVLNIIGKLANQPNSVIDELGFEDMNVLAEYFSAFS